MKLRRVRERKLRIDVRPVRENYNYGSRYHYGKLSEVIEKAAADLVPNEHPDTIKALGEL